MANVAPLLRQVDIPVLVIIGKKDIQVDWQAAEAGYCWAGEGDLPLPRERKSRSQRRAAASVRVNASPEVTESYNDPDIRLNPEALVSILSGW